MDADAQAPGADEATRRPRTPPTIDLEAAHVDQAEPAAAPAAPARAPGSSRLPLTIMLAALAGAVGAVAVGVAAWTSGALRDPNALDTSTIAMLETIGARVTRLETMPARPAATQPDSALTGRVDTLDKSIGALRDTVTALQSRSEAAGKTSDDAGAAPRDPAAATEPAPNAAVEAAVQALSARLAQLEAAQAKTELRADQLQAATEQAVQASADTKAARAAPPDDIRLRRAVVAVALDLAVRQGEPLGAELAAAKALAPDATALAPLEPFASTGVPGVMLLAGDLAPLLPQPVPPAERDAGAGWLARLQASAARLIRIRRTDAATVSDGSTALGRVVAAAGRNDLAEARRQIAALPPADRARLQPWLDKVDARDAARDAARRFAAMATAALANPAP